MAGSSSGQKGHTSESIAKAIRTWIVEGSFGPGDRLPTRAELLQQFEVSPVTMQRAFHRLIDDGFVETRGKGGTLVAPAPPHLRCYGLVLEVRRSRTSWYDTLASAADAISRKDRRITCYEGVLPESRGDLEQLLDDIEHHRVAGLIFGNHPFALDGTPLMRDLKIPAVALMNGEHPQFPTLSVDSRSFYQRAIARIAAKGRKRFAVLLYLHHPVEQMWDETQLQELGLETHPKWWQIANPRYAESIERILWLLLDAPAERRPDALIVADDNLAANASRALVKLGIDPEELTVISLCNYPQRPRTVWPLTFLGFDVNALMRTAVQRIDDQRAGRETPAFEKFAAIFEDER